MRITTSTASSRRVRRGAPICHLPLWERSARRAGRGSSQRNSTQLGARRLLLPRKPWTYLDLPSAREILSGQSTVLSPRFAFAHSGLVVRFAPFGWIPSFPRSLPLREAGGGNPEIAAGQCTHAIPACAGMTKAHHYRVSALGKTWKRKVFLRANRLSMLAPEAACVYRSECSGVSFPTAIRMRYGS